MSEKKYIVMVRGGGYANSDGGLDCDPLSLTRAQAVSSVQTLLQMGYSAGQCSSDVSVWASTYIKVSATVDIVD